MDSPGELIREARRQKGLSPEEVFRIARVRPGLLEKVEEDALTALPEDPYARGLYASLARAVGADADRVLAAYDHLRSTRSATVFREQPVRDEPPGAPAGGGPRPLGVIVAVIALALVLGLVWIGGRRDGGGTGGKGGGRGGDAPEAAGAGDGTAPQAARAELDSFYHAGGGVALVAMPIDTAAASGGTVTDSTMAGLAGADTAVAGEDAPPPPPTEAAAETGGGPVDSLAVRVERVAAPHEGGVAAVPTQGATVQPLDSDTPALPGITAPERELVLEARAGRDTWMRVVIDGVRTRAGILPAGETRSWRARSDLRIDVAAVEDVRFRLNGRPVDAGEPRHGLGHLVLRWEHP